MPGEQLSQLLAPLVRVSIGKGCKHKLSSSSSRSLAGRACGSGALSSGLWVRFVEAEVAARLLERSSLWLGGSVRLPMSRSPHTQQHSTEPEPPSRTSRLSQSPLHSVLYLRALSILSDVSPAAPNPGRPLVRTMEGAPPIGAAAGLAAANGSGPVLRVMLPALRV